jgi:hypothetical protein
MNAEVAATYDDSDPWERIVSVALSGGAEQAKVKGFHDIAAHALRGGSRSLYRSLYSAEEWQILVDHAKKVGAESALHSPVTGLSPLEGYRQVYGRAARLNGLKGEALETHVEEMLDQERVGGLAEMWASGTDFGRQINTLLARILRFLEAVRNALQGHGFQTYEDVFERVVAGEVAQRGDKRVEEERKADEEIDASWPEMREAAVEAARRKEASGRRVVARDEAALEADRQRPQTRVRDADEARRVGREQAEALKRLDERRRAGTPQAPSLDADERLPDLDALDTFTLRHLAKDLDLPGNQWRGREAAEIRKAIKTGRSAAEIRRAIKSYLGGSL